MAVCLAFLGQTNANALSPANGLPTRQRIALQRFIAGVKVTFSVQGAGQAPRTVVVASLSSEGADTCTFANAAGANVTVAAYFRQTNRPLQYPSVLCIKVCFMHFPPSYSDYGNSLNAET